MLVDTSANDKILLFVLLVILCILRLKGNKQGTVEVFRGYVNNIRKSMIFHYYHVNYFAS